MKSVNWQGSTIRVDPPKKPKKITGTHFATVLGVNPYATPFEAWCRCTRTYEKPFEGNEFTHAGEVIEPKVYEFLRTSMGYGDRVKRPSDFYGDDYFKKTRGDFFPDDLIFGGMWDFLILTEDYSDTEYVVEVKTVWADGRQGSLDNRWKGGEAPHYQALQASLYANRKGVDKVLMVAVPLYKELGDYEHPEKVVVSFAEERVYLDEFKVSERYPNFDLYIEQATSWWNTHVVNGVSPEFDEKKDAEILKALRTNTVSVSEDVTELLGKAEQLKSEIEAVTATLSDKEKELKALTDAIKKYALDQFRDGDTSVSIKGQRYEFILSKSETTELDKDALAADGLLEKYTKPKTNYRLTTSKIKED